MKRILVLFLAPLLISCNSKKELEPKKKHFKLELQREIKNGEYYFDFDIVEFYNIDIDEEKAIGLWTKNKRTNKEEALSKIIGNHDFPKSISEISFLDTIEDLGYKKIIVEESKKNEIKNIFRFKKFSETNSYACPAIYRDILIFKLNQKIVGIAKICFGCRHHYIIGTNVNTEEFGQGGDYEKLYEILFNKKIIN